MRILSRELSEAALAGALLNDVARTVCAPNGKHYCLGPDGAGEVDDDCGLDLVGGYTVIAGAPRGFVPPTAAGPGRADGPPVEVFTSIEMAGQEVHCPDGHTVARFEAWQNGKARAVVPETCGLKGHADYEFGGPVDAESEAARHVTANRAAAEARLQELLVETEHLRRLLGLGAARVAVPVPAAPEAAVTLAAAPELEPGVPAEAAKTAEVKARALRAAEKARQKAAD